jgi:hypothetical protein
MKTVKKVVITNEEWETLNNASELLESWYREAAGNDYESIDAMFEAIGDKYDGYSCMSLIRNVLNEVCDVIDVED